MKNTPAILTSTLFLFIVLFNTCKEDDPSGDPVKFQGIVFTDEVGNSLGTYGGADDNDWKYDTTWTEEIEEIMDFQDTVDLSGTYLNQTFAPEDIFLTFFPNPAANQASTYILMPGRIKVRMAIVDGNMNTLFSYSYKDQDTSWITLNLSDETRFIEGEVYRMYYTFSVTGNENFYKGHGDILMCYQRPASLLCVDYLEE